MKPTHEKIIDAAKELFESNGFEATTTREIAKRAGVSEVTLFRHFETKRNLFNQTIYSCMHPYKLEAYLENDVTYDLETDLKYIAKNMMATYQKNLPLLRMMFKGKMSKSACRTDLKKSERHAHNKLLTYFETMKKQGKLSAEPDMALTFFMSNINGVFFRVAFSEEDSEINLHYFEWMLDKVTIALRNNI